MASFTTLQTLTFSCIAILIAALFVGGGIFVSNIFLRPLILPYAPTQCFNVYAPSKQRIHILVLGDLGRSPRMTNHAQSFAKYSTEIDLIGYLESSFPPDIATHPRIRVRLLDPPPQKPSYVPFLLFAPWKVIRQMYDLFQVLAYRTSAADWLLVQNPPSIPTLLISSLVCYLRGTRLIIDWHNYGWTILEGTRGKWHPLVALHFWYECYFGRLGYLNFTVTDAMGEDLKKRPYSIKSPIITLHDRPAAVFRRFDDQDEANAVLEQVIRVKHFVPALQERRMRLVVSSTSWTPDEDFSLFLDALVMYADSPLNKSSDAQPLLVIITGKGPQREMYERRFAQLQSDGRLANITITTDFLPFRDYARLLGCADLGVCLHKSSSGLDLPMKIVDMLGAGLAILAYSEYKSFGELIQEGKNGLGFKTAEELAGHMTKLFGPGGDEVLEKLRAGAAKERSHQWQDEWDLKVADAIELKQCLD